MGIGLINTGTSYVIISRPTHRAIKQECHMSYTSLAQSVVDWALSKVGCEYSQAKRTQENIFDGSSLSARAYSAQCLPPS